MAASPQRFYRPELDGLRFCAFLAVFASHGLPRDAAAYSRLLPLPLAQFVAGSLDAGGNGVDLFFVLSAYLITELLLREFEGTGRLDVRAFYVRRALRIWPLYFTFLLGAFFFESRLLGAQLPAHHFFAFLLFAGNWACVRWGYPHSSAAPLWSVSIEEQFYIAWPLVLSAFGVTRIKRIALVMFGVATLARVVLYLQGAGWLAFWCNTFARLDSIAAGALIAVTLRGRGAGLGAVARGALAVGGVLLWVAAKWGVVVWGAPARFITYPAVTLGSAAMLLAALRPAGSGSWLAHPALVYLGRISYGLYVFHVFCIAFVARRAPWWAVPALSLAFTVALAAVSYRWLEKPFLKLKERFARVRSRPVEEIPAAPALSAAVPAD
jgi:peptidoglycan/LPS O-acetylase OafA/YrhL